MPAPRDRSAPRRRPAWLAGAATAVLLAVVATLLSTPSPATTLPPTAAAALVAADATRGKVTLTLGGSAVPAELSDARLAAAAVPGAFSPTAYAALEPATRGLGGTWLREAVVPADGSVPARYRLRVVDGRGVWLVAQDWGGAGLTFDGLLELPADVAAGRSWSSTGTARGRTDEPLRFTSAATATVPDDPGRAAAGCLSVTGRTALTGPEAQTWTDTSLWCPGKGVVAGEGELRGTSYAVTSGGAASPVTDADLGPARWDTSGVGSWRLRTRTVVGGDGTFGLVDAAGTALLDPGAPPVVDASGVVTFPTLEGGDLVGLLDPDGPDADLRAHWWARPGGQVTSSATTGSLVVVATTARRVAAYRAGRTLAWTAGTDDAAVAPPLPVQDDAVAVATVRGTLSLLDARTGALRWRARVGGGVHAPLGGGDGVVVSADTTGAVTAWDAASGRRRWSVDDAANPFATTLVVAGGQVVVAAGGTVSAYAVADGHRTWVREAGPQLDLMTLVGDTVWVGVGDDLQAWSVGDGTQRFAVAGARPLPAAGCAGAGETLGLARRGTDLVVLDAAGGTRGAWPLPVPVGTVLDATCRGAGVDLTAYPADGSSGLRVLRLAAP